MRRLGPRLEPEPIGVLPAARPVRLGELAQLGQRVAVGGEQCFDLGHLLEGDYLEGAGQQGVQVGEVVMQQPVGDAGATGHVACGGAGEAVLGDLGNGGIEDLCAA